MTRVVAPTASGVLSALGLVVSERRRDLVESASGSGTSSAASAWPRSSDGWEAAVARSSASPTRSCAPPTTLPRVRRSSCPWTATSSPTCPSCGALRPRPRRALRLRRPRRAELSQTVRVAAAMPGAEPALAAPAPAEERGSRSLLFGGQRLEASVFGPGELEAEGPAVVELPGSTLVVPPGWTAAGGPRRGGAELMTRLDPIALQVMVEAARPARRWAWCWCGRRTREHQGAAATTPPPACSTPTAAW